MKKIVDRDNKNRLLDFLMGLDATYEVAKDQILSSDPLPTVNQAFFKIQQIEMQRSIHHNAFDAQENMAMAAHKTGYNQSSFSKGYFPSSAGKAYQTVAAHTLSRDNKRSRKPLECDYCGKRGHTRHYCFKLMAHNKANGAVKTDFRGRIAAHVEET
ncbi:hypothetical protein RND81_11G035300 [Saponaria officinalis]|uniref:CCHC-type domain-containing protein n=1 Tax=Saponaria officinalis TaxID=3572 RepID=A0AAW1HHC3_SAPOF